MTPEGLVELYEAERSVLTRSVERIVGDQHAAEDLVHDAFVAYLTSDPEAQRPGAWLSRVARNRALNHVRRASPLPLAEAASEDASASSGPEREAVRAVVAEALGQLPDRDRSALALRFYEGLSYAEVAERLDLRVEQTHLVVHRSLRRLGREVVRRLADAHGAGSCASALARMAGLTAGVDDHPDHPCEECAGAWDEISALRALPALAPVAAKTGMLRHAVDRIVSRGAAFAEPAAANVAGAMMAIAVAASTALPHTAALAPKPPASVISSEANIATQGLDAATQRHPAGSKLNRTGGSSAKFQEPTTTAKNTSLGGANLSSGGSQTQVEASPPAPGTGSGGVVVCQPLEPCPPTQDR